MDHPRFTPAELRVLHLIAQGLSCKEAALVLDVTEGTVRTHRQRLQEKLDVYGVEALTVLAVEHVRLHGCCAGDSVSSIR